MKLSKHNIISAIADSEDYFIVNLLSQEADILTPDNYKSILSGKYTNTVELVQKGYLVDPVEEEKLFRKKYLEFLDKTRLKSRYFMFLLIPVTLPAHIVIRMNTR